MGHGGQMSPKILRVLRKFALKCKRHSDNQIEKTVFNIHRIIWFKFKMITSENTKGSTAKILVT